MPSPAQELELSFGIDLFAHHGHKKNPHISCTSVLHAHKQGPHCCATGALLIPSTSIPCPISCLGTKIMRVALNPLCDSKLPKIPSEVPTKINVSLFLQSDAGWWRGAPRSPHWEEARRWKQHGALKQVIPSPGSFCSVFLLSSNHFSLR